MSVGHNQKTPEEVFTALEAPNPPNLYPPPLKPQDVEIEIFASPLLVESDSDAPTCTQAQGRKRKANKQPENCVKPILWSTKKAVNDPKEDAESHTTAYPNGTNIKKAISIAQQVDGMENLQKTVSAKVQNAIAKAQERTRKETEMKNAMWGRIAKAVDEAIEVEPLGNIESHHVEHIVNAILYYTLLYWQKVDKTNA